MFSAILSAATPMDNITSGGGQAVTFLSKAFETMTGNPYLAVFLGVTMIGAGIGLFRKLRRGT